MVNNFNKDLKIGKIGEKILFDYLYKRGIIEEVLFGDNSDYDILVTKGKYKGVMFEVKYDQYDDTGNMILEIFCLRRLIKTGILSTKAKYFCYIFKYNNTGYIIKVETLKQLLKKIPKNIVTNGGDNNSSIMVKLPYKNYIKQFYKFNY